MAENIRSSNRRSLTQLDNPGPYIAKVVNNVDPMRMGGLTVELFRTVGNQTDLNDTAVQQSYNDQIFSVRYLSPFYGVTGLDYNGTDPNTFNDTQKSYGFWMVPPDPGTLVMVIFVDGNTNQGYWIGCVPQPLMNHMIPGIAGSENFASVSQSNDETAWGENAVSTTTLYPETEILPVAEINRKAIKENKSKLETQVLNNTRPVHPIADVLQRQGLITDVHRGVHTSSVVRESPSNVFGISTPGPIDKRTNSKQGTVGPKDESVTKSVSRLGGHTIVMDDGNDRILRKNRPGEGPPEYVNLEKGETGGHIDLPMDESFRIRTRTGHQILLHNTEDFIYITNSRGTAWIELTSNGKIDIYAKDSISMHTEVDFNITADRDINLTSGGNSNINSVGNHRNSAGGWHETSTGGPVILNSASDLNITAGTNFQLATEAGGISANARNGDLKLASTGTTAVAATQKIAMVGGTGIGLATDGDYNVQSEGGIRHASYSYDQYVSDGGHYVQVNGPISLKTNQSYYHEYTGDYAIKAANIWFDTASGGEIHLNSGKAIEKITKLNNGELGHQATADARAFKGLHASPSAGDPMYFYPSAPIAPMSAGIASRVPQHEPWLQHENLNPQIYTPEYTRFGVQPLDSYGPYVYQTPFPSGGSTDNGYTQEDDSGVVGPNGDGQGDGLTERAKYAMDFFKGKGMTESQAAAVVGNLQVESGSNLNEKASYSTGSETSYGIAQWNSKGSPERWYKFSQKFGKPLTSSSFDEQLEWIWIELTDATYGDNKSRKWWNEHAKPRKDLNTVETARILAGAFDDLFERSSGAARSIRQSHAARLFDEYVRGVQPGSDLYPSVPGEQRPDKSVSPVNTNSAAPLSTTDPALSPKTPYAAGGLWQDRVHHTNLGARSIRNQQIGDPLTALLNRAAHRAGVDAVEVFSGKQPHVYVGGDPEEPPAGSVTGTGRHNTGLAADIYIYVNERRVDSRTSSGKAKWEEFIACCVAEGALGIGHSKYYMNSPGDTNGALKAHIDMLGVGYTKNGNTIYPGKLGCWGQGSVYQGLVNTGETWVDDAARNTGNFIRTYGSNDKA